VGIIYALLAAISAGSHDIVFSRPEVKPLPGLYKALLSTLGALLPIIGAGLLHFGFISPDAGFWFYVTLHAGLLTAALWLYMRALALGPVSQTQPILALTTVFLVFTTPFMTDDIVTPLGWVGVVMVGLGIYATQHPGVNPATGRPYNFWSPFVEMMRQPGVLAKLGVAVIYSVTANLDRLCLETAGSLATYLLIDKLLVVAIIAALLGFGQFRIGAGRTRDKAKARPWWLLGGGLVHGLEVVAHMVALTFMAVPYVIAVKRLSIVITSLWGYLVRRERQLNWYRLVGLGLVMAGIAVILIFGVLRQA